MELGSLQYRCQGQNILHGAIHPVHGLAWTEGRSIFLTPINIYKGHVVNEEHSKLGEFDRGVKAITWSDTITEGLCYMCVVHDKNISLWKVEGRQPKLSFKQVRKVNIQPIPQGCLWNPRRDIVCVLCPQQSSLYYSHIQNKGSQVLLQLDRDKIQCGCWLADGSKLVICVGTTLMVFYWSNIDNSVTQYTSVPWTVPGLLGRISTVATVSNTRIIYAAELPLESLCKQQADTFLLPDTLNSNGLITDDITDGEIIKPTGKQETSLTETLLNIPRNPQSLVEDSSRLGCVELNVDKDPLKFCNINVKGILTPDILLYEPSLQLAIVGSNTQTVLQVFTVAREHFDKSAEIVLQSEERPRGISCCLSTSKVAGLLLVVGKKNPGDTAFPTSSNTVVMKSVLKFFNLKQGRFDKNPLTHTQSAPSIPLSVATNGHHDNSQDYDLITQNVMNFGVSIHTSVPDLQNKENTAVMPNYVQGTELRSSSENYDNHKTSNSLSEEIANSLSKDRANTLSKDIAKTLQGEGQSGDLENVSKKNVDQNKSEEVATPPKRPVRKKKSLRGKESFSMKGSNTGQGQAKLAGKMPMEYSSDSPEMSPREVHTAVDTKQLESGLKYKTVVGNTADVVPSQTSQNVCHKDAENVLPKDNKSVPNKETEILNSKDNVSEKLSTGNDDEIKLTISAGVDTAQPHKGITEIGHNTDSVQELEIEKVDFKSQKTNFQSASYNNLISQEMEDGQRIQNILTEKLKAKESQKLVKSKANLSLSLESLEDIDKILKEQNKKISKLQEQMNKLSSQIDESSCVMPSRYQSSDKPDTVQLCLQCPDGSETKKTFLLDHGRLQLQEIKQAFTLHTVEICIDGEPCVTGANIDGYIPMRFQANTTIYISGNPAIGQASNTSG